MITFDDITWTKLEQMGIKPLPLHEMMAALAEECAELAQACLKMRRLVTRINETPKTLDECIDDLMQELADVYLYVLLAFDGKSCEEEIRRIMEQKIARWAERSKPKGGEVDAKS